MSSAAVQANHPRLRGVLRCLQTRETTASAGGQQQASLLSLAPSNVAFTHMAAQPQTVEHPARVLASLMPTGSCVGDPMDAIIQLCTQPLPPPPVLLRRRLSSAAPSPTTLVSPAPCAPEALPRPSTATSEVNARAAPPCDAPAFDPPADAHAHRRMESEPQHEPAAGATTLQGPASGASFSSSSSSTSAPAPPASSSSIKRPAFAAPKVHVSVGIPACPQALEGCEEKPGWFSPCRGCRQLTAYSADLGDALIVPLCRRCKARVQELSWCSEDGHVLRQVILQRHALMCTHGV